MTKQTNNNLRAVILDFGGVLLHLGDPRPHEDLARQLGIPVNELRHEVFDGPLSVAAQRGEISPAALWAALAAKWGWPPERSAELARAFWAGVRVDAVWPRWLQTLRPTYRTGLLSNAWSDLRDLLHHLGLAGVFDAMVISAEERLLKPDPAIYRLILDRLGVPPQQAVFVDDRPENIAAARALGMHGILYRSTEQALHELQALGLPGLTSKPHAGHPRQ